MNFPGQNTGVVSLSLLQGSSQPRDRTQVFHIAGRFFTSWATREAQAEFRIWQLYQEVGVGPAWENDGHFHPDTSLLLIIKG